MVNTDPPSASGAIGTKAFVHKGTNPKVLRRLAESGFIGMRENFALMGLSVPPEFTEREAAARCARIFPCKEFAKRRAVLVATLSPSVSRSEFSLMGILLLVS